MNKITKIITKIKGGFLKKALFELKWTYQLLSIYRKHMFLYFIMMIISTLISMCITVKMGSLVDGIISQQWIIVIQTAFIYICIGSVNVILSMCSQRVSGKVCALVKTELSKKTYKKILQSDWQMVTKMHSGDLMTRLQEDIGTVASSTVGWIPTLCMHVTSITISLCIIVYYDLSMLFVVILAAPIVLVGSRIFLSKMYESNKQQRTISSEIMSLYKESFQHLQTIKGFDLADFFCDKMSGEQNKRQKIDLDVNKYSIASWGVMYVSGQIAALICLTWAILQVYHGEISMGTMAVLAMLASKIASSFKAFIQLIPTAVNMISSTERIRTILELPEEKLENQDLYQKMYKESLYTGAGIVIKDLNFGYQDGKNIFENVQYTIEAGEIVALVGPSGEGKTTMLRILLGIVNTDNSCMIQTDSFCLSVGPEGRKMMAYVPQGNTMLHGTIAENMRMLKPNATEEEIIAALKEACAYDFVQKLPDGIHHVIGESGGGFSEGQNQRLSIARALMCKTPIILLDEATSALDVATERKVLDNLMKVSAKRTCIITTHRPTVLNMCDRVYRIAEKKVTEIGEQEIHELMDDF